MPPRRAIRADSFLVSGDGTCRIRDCGLAVFTGVYKVNALRRADGADDGRHESDRIRHNSMNSNTVSTSM